MRRCLVIRKRLALRRRFKDRALRRLYLQLVGERRLSDLLDQLDELLVSSSARRATTVTD